MTEEHGKTLEAVGGVVGGMRLLPPGASSVYVALDVWTQTHTIQDMTPTAAEAQRAIARSMYEVPAQEATRQVQTREMGSLGRHALNILMLGVIIVGALVTLEGALLAWCLAGLGTCVAGVTAATRYLDRQPKP